MKIKNIEASTLFEYHMGVREHFEYKDALFANSLFLDFLKQNGMKIQKDGSTRDIICLEFHYGSRSYHQELDHLYKIALSAKKEFHRAKVKNDQYLINRAKSKEEKISGLLKEAIKNKKKYTPLTKEQLRKTFYHNGVSVQYIIRKRNGEISKQETIHYKMLFRSTGKAKKGACMFIRSSLYKKARDFLYMGIKLPKNNAMTVEISAYAPLVASGMIDKISIPPENILILKDVDRYFHTNVVSVETNENRECIADMKKEALGKENKDSLEKWNKKIEETNQKLRKQREELQGYRDDLSATGEASPELDSIIEKLSLIDHTLLSKSKNLVSFINSDVAAKDKQQLTELANSGKLTADILEKDFHHVNEYLKNNGLELEDLISTVKTYSDELHSAVSEELPLPFSKEEMISAINGMSEGFDSIRKIFDDVKDGGTFDFTLFDNQKFKDTFGELGKEYTNFIDTITDSPDDIDACQEAFDSLVGKWISSVGILDKIDEGNAKLTASMLELMGVTNATELVQAQLQANRMADTLGINAQTTATLESVDAIYSQINGLFEEAGASDLAASALYQLIAQQTIFSNSNLNTTEKIQALEKLAKSFGIVADSADIANARSMMNSEIMIASKSGKAPDQIAADIASIEGSYVNYISSFYEDAIGEKFGNLSANYSGHSKNDRGSSGKSASNPYEVDHIKTRIQYLQKQHDLLNAIADDEGVSYNERISSIKDMMALDRERMAFDKQATAEYENRWLTAMSKLTAEQAHLIMYGGLDISNYGGGEKENLEASIKAWEAYENQRTQADEREKESLVHLKEEVQLREEIIKAQQDQISAEMDLLQSRMDYLEASGGVLTEGMLKEQITLSKELSSSYEDQIDNLYEQLDLAENGSAEYYSILASIGDCEQAILDCRTRQAEWNEQILRLPIDRIQKYIHILQNIKQDLLNFMDEQGVYDDHGATKEQYQELIHLSQKEIDQLLEQKGKLKDLLSQYQYGSEKFNDTAQEIQDIDDAVSDLIQSQKEWNQEILNIPIHELDSLTGNLQSMADAMEQVAADYNTAIDTVIDTIERQKETVQETYQAQITGIQETIDALQKENEERQATLQLEQAKADLERAQQQKTNKIIRNGEFVYEADQNAIRDAKESYDQILFDQQISDLNTAKEALQEALDQELEALDQIAEKWQQIAEDMEYAHNSEIADSVLGEGWQDKVLSGDDQNIYELFRHNFETLSKQQEAYEKQIQTNENLSKFMQQYGDAYLNGTISYEEAVKAMQGIADSMKDGFSSLDNLDAISGIFGESIDGILSSFTVEADKIIHGFGEYFKIAEDNSKVFEQYSKTWEEMRQNIAAQLKALEEMAKNLEEMKEEIRKDTPTSGSGGSDKPVWSKPNDYYTGNYSPSGEKAPDYVNSGPGVQLSSLSRASFTGPGHDLSITPEQRNTLLNSFSKASLSGNNISLLGKAAPVNTGTSVVFDGDIVLNDVQKPDELAKALRMNFASLMRQEMNKHEQR